MNQSIWVFTGNGAMHPCAVFSTKRRADAWIQASEVSGTLTAYPIDQSVYDWAVENGHFVPKFPYHSESACIQRFSSAHAEHYHYENGRLHGQH